MGKGKILGALIIIFGAWFLISNITKNGKTETSNQDTNTAQSDAVTDDDMEEFCQDTIIKSKYVNTDKISLIAILDYNKNFTPLGSSYDINGNPIYLLTWNGKNKDTDTIVSFACYASGQKDNLTLQYLSMSGVALYGSLDFETYDADGNKKE